MDNVRNLSALNGLFGRLIEIVHRLRNAVRSCTRSRKNSSLPQSRQVCILQQYSVRMQRAFADCVMTNGSHVAGSWIRGEQEGNVGRWLSTIKEIWRFDLDLTYEHKIERYDSAITTGPFLQSSYLRPKMSLERGI